MIKQKEKIGDEIAKQTRSRKKKNKGLYSKYISTGNNKISCLQRIN